MKSLTFHELRVRLGRRELTTEELYIRETLDKGSDCRWRLSAQERRVLACTERWKESSQRDMAWSLGLKLKTFKAHLYNARKKLT